MCARMFVGWLVGWELEARARSRCCVSSEPLRGDSIGIRIDHTCLFEPFGGEKDASAMIQSCLRVATIVHSIGKYYCG